MLCSFVYSTIWATSWQNQQNDMCAQRRLRSAWASAQTDQSLHCPHEEALGSQLPIRRTAKTLIRLGGCSGWSESSLGAQVILLVLSWGGSYNDILVFFWIPQEHAQYKVHTTPKLDEVMPEFQACVTLSLKYDDSNTGHINNCIPYLACFARDVSIICRKRSPFHNFSVVENFQKCNPPEFKFYLGLITNKKKIPWCNVNFEAVFFASYFVQCKENSLKISITVFAVEQLWDGLTVFWKY